MKDEDKPRFQPIEDKPEFVKDNRTGAILNIDNNGLQAYKKQKAAMAETKDRLDKIESEVTEIKDLLQEILGKFK